MDSIESIGPSDSMPPQVDLHDSHGPQNDGKNAGGLWAETVEKYTSIGRCVESTRGSALEDLYSSVERLFSSLVHVVSTYFPLAPQELWSFGRKIRTKCHGTH